MARGKRRAPVKPEVIVPSENINPNDEVDDFIAQRHKVMLEKVQASSDDSDDSGGEPELREHDVLNIDMSDSDEIEEQSGSSDGDADGHDDLEERRGWGGKKNLWYGGDTHEYEIMEDEEREEALKEEEEEALRLQKKALENLRPEDYRDDDDDDEDVTEAGDDEGDERQDDEFDVLAGSNFASSEVAARVLSETAPEIPILIKEMLECRKQAGIWKERVHWNEVARILYHLYASFVCNVAFYLSLRTDPDSLGVDIRTHPVLVQIVRIRSLIKDTRALPCEEPVAKPSQRDPPSANLVSDDPKTVEMEMPANGVDGKAPYAPVANGKMKYADGKKNRKKRKKSRGKSQADDLEDDEEKVRALLPSTVKDKDEAEAEEERRQERKRRKLNSLVGAMERERKNSNGKRLASVDADVVRAEPAPKTAGTYTPERDDANAELQMDDMDDDDEVMQKVLAKKAKKDARKARKAAEVKPHVYTFKDTVDPEARRRASSQVVKNRGLTRYRPKDKKTPRTKNRLAYSKAVVRRKGAVQDYAGKPGSSYSGEASGINMSARKGSRLSNV